MFNSPVLDTAISLVFVYLLLATLVSCVQEVWAQVRNNRGKLLKAAIEKLLQDELSPEAIQKVLQHPHINMMKKKGDRHASFLEGGHFARAVIDIVAGLNLNPATDIKLLVNPTANNTPGDTFAGFQSNVAAITAKTQPTDGLKSLAAPTPAVATSTPNNSSLGLLNSFASNATNMQELTEQVTAYFDNYMDRVSGWYKRMIRKELLVWSALVAIVLNVNFIDIAGSVYKDSGVRNKLTAAAVTYTVNTDSVSIPKLDSINALVRKADSTRVALTDFGLPVGWNLQCNHKDSGFFKKIGCVVSGSVKEIEKKGIGHTLFGWLFSIIIMSFGAPFWFDILKKLVNVRNAGEKPDPKAKN
jgi:hypothetical protein